MECESLHHLECPCFFGFRYQKETRRYSKILEDWTEKLINVANREEFHNREVFWCFRKIIFFIWWIISGFHNQHSTLHKKTSFPKTSKWKHRLFLHVVRLFSLFTERLCVRWVDHFFIQKKIFLFLYI